MALPVRGQVKFFGVWEGGPGDWGTLFTGLKTYMRLPHAHGPAAWGLRGSLLVVRGDAPRRPPQGTSASRVLMA